MPNFSIRRRKRAQPEPKEETPSDVEEKVDETEMSESSDEQAYLDKAIEDLKKVTINDKVETIPQSPARSEAHVENHPRLERGYTRNDQYRPQYRQPNRMNDPYRHKPTMDYQIPSSKYRRGGSKIRFSSHYGLGGEHLDTRTKSALLYQHCFG